MLEGRTSLFSHRLQISGRLAPQRGLCLGNDGIHPAAEVAGDAQSHRVAFPMNVSGSLLSLGLGNKDRAMNHADGCAMGRSGFRASLQGIKISDRNRPTN